MVILVLKDEHLNFIALPQADRPILCGGNATEAREVLMKLEKANYPGRNVIIAPDFYPLNAKEKEEIGDIITTGN